MFNFTKISTTIATILIWSLSSQAATLELGVPSYGGTGCPAGSAGITVSPANDAISILFDQFVSEAGSTTNRRIDRKSCNISIPVKVPQGYSVAVFSIDYRGFNAVPSGGFNRLNSEYFWAGSRGPSIARTFYGPINDNYTVTDDLIATSIVWAPCGASVNLRVNASMMAQSNNRMEQTIGTVDSADLTSALIYHIQWRRCN
jgi:hypothetical protein